jgi:hypothetical protein
VAAEDIDSVAELMAARGDKAWVAAAVGTIAIVAATPQSAASRRRLTYA